MHVYVTFRHMEPSDAIRSYAEEKTTRLVKYLFEPAEVHWVLSIEKIRHIADVTIVENGVTVKAQESTDDMYSAIDTVLDKLEKQVRKYKDKLKDHKPHEEPAKVRFSGAMAEEEVEEAAPSTPRIVRRESQFIKPMSVEEAVMQMDVAGRNFFLFTDFATGNVNLIYRTGDGDYGLVSVRK